MKDLLLKGWVKMQVLKATIVNDESGQDLIEYALVAALIALACTVGMTAVAQNINAAFNTIGNRLSGYVSAS
jgi:pilus assembly protein Flp/PilA